MFPTLKIGDGFAKIAIEKRDAVLRLQRALVRASFKIDADGLFGQGTRKVVMAFQDQMGLVVDGVVGPATWSKLKPFLRVGEKQYNDFNGKSLLQGFNGDLTWVHEREGHAGRPYWPGGASGVTLDPGFDLGYQNRDQLRACYPELSAYQIQALTKVIGLKGESAKIATRIPSIASIRTSKEMALTAMPVIAKRYWKGIYQRFPSLVAQTQTPPCVHTVMLSLSYNRGPNNRGLEVLRAYLEDLDWTGLAQQIASMQQNHKLRGIRLRRRLEAEYILNELSFQADHDHEIDNQLLYNPEY